MNSPLLLVALVLALVLASTAIVVASVAARRAAAGSARRTSSRRRNRGVPADVEGLRAEVRALRTEVSGSLRQLALVRYDAFEDMGGRLSWSLALLDDGGNGVVLTSIHGRSEARSYAKNVVAWSCRQMASPEEEEAIKHVRSRLS